MLHSVYQINNTLSTFKYIHFKTLFPYDEITFLKHDRFQNVEWEFELL